MSKTLDFIKRMIESIKNTFISIGTKKIIIFLIIFVLFLWIVLSFFRTSSNNTFYDGDQLSYSYISTQSGVSGTNLYSKVYLSYQSQNLNEIQDEIIIDHANISGFEADNSYQDILNEYQSYRGQNTAYLVNDEHQSVTLTLDVIQNGIYAIELDYYDLESTIDDTQLGLKINGVSPFYESSTLSLPARWTFVTTTFSLDRYQNEIQPQSEKMMGWQTFKLKDRTGLHPESFLYHLKSGDVITIEYKNYEFLLGQVKLTTQEEYMTYDAYINQYANATKYQGLMEISARDIAERSDPSIRLRADQEPSNMYYDTQFLRMNTIFGDSWQNGGGAISYHVLAPHEGLYQLSFKYRQYMIRDLPVFRTIKVNGEVPFKELNSYAFPYTVDFLNRTLVDENENPLWIYLEAGSNTITLEAQSYPYRNTIEKLKEIMSNIQNLALDIKRYTAGGTDLYRDWDIDEYFPDAKDDINFWADEINFLHSELTKMSPIDEPSEISNLKVASARLKQIAADINKLPSRMTQFSDGDSSVNQLLGTLTQRFLYSNMELEKIMAHGNSDIPNPYANIFVSTYEGTVRLFLSFINNPYSVQVAKENELAVWVNHPRQYIEVMQALIDDMYVGDYAITLSQMPDQNKLILANASGTSPDIAIGVDHWIPYEFAIRDAAVNLRQFDGYAETVAQFSKGAMIPYVFEEGVFAIPETQNFQVTYYREDILNSIGITQIPQTWDQIIEILPILQSYGMNYFIPLAQFTGLKPFVATLPFIYQFGGDLYTPNGMQTAINSEQTLKGITLMSELYTLYNMPKYVGSFYNQFRYGMLPIGVSDLGTYLLLQNTAVELQGLWKMDLHPGVLDPVTNEINRFAASGAQSSMILSSSKDKEASWDFLSWWMSTEIQSLFALTLQSTYGKAYFWNTANLEAFETTSMPKVYKDIVLQQWEYAVEASRIPGSYMVEREISNAWTKIVFDNINPRQALDEAVRISNRETLYKMSEFGYIVNGQIIKDYIVPSIYNIDNWLTEVEG